MSHQSRAARGSAPLGSPEWYADPGTPEYDIAAAGIHTRAGLDAATTRTPKGPALLGAIVTAVLTRACKMLSDEADTLLLALLDEPAITGAHLAAMSDALPGRQRTGLIGDGRATLMAAICTHPLAEADTVISCLWDGSAATAADVTRTIGLLGAATWWVRCMWHRSGLRGWAVPYAPTDIQRRQILELSSRWAGLTAGDPALAAFLATGAFTFTDEDAMFAAGRAVCAAPARSTPRT